MPVQTAPTNPSTQNTLPGEGGMTGENGGAQGGSGSENGIQGGTGNGSASGGNGGM
jgi:hypothetical protein